MVGSKAPSMFPFLRLLLWHHLPSAQMLLFQLISYNSAVCCLQYSSAIWLCWLCSKMYTHISFSSFNAMQGSPICCVDRNMKPALSSADDNAFSQVFQMLSWNCFKALHWNVLCYFSRSPWWFIQTFVKIFDPNILISKCWEMLTGRYLLLRVNHNHVIVDQTIFSLICKNWFEMGRC